MRNGVLAPLCSWMLIVLIKEKTRVTRKWLTLLLTQMSLLDPQLTLTRFIFFTFVPLPNDSKKPSTCGVNVLPHTAMPSLNFLCPWMNQLEKMVHFLIISKIVHSHIYILHHLSFLQIARLYNILISQLGFLSKFSKSWVFRNVPIVHWCRRHCWCSQVCWSFFCVCGLCFLWIFRNLFYPIS